MKSRRHEENEETPRPPDETGGATRPVEVTPAIDLDNPTVVSTPEKDGEEPRLDALENAYSRLEERFRLGAGGVGIVTCCLDPHLGRLVAVKTLRTKLKFNLEHNDRFVREAKVMAQL